MEELENFEESLGELREMLRRQNKSEDFINGAVEMVRIARKMNLEIDEAKVGREASALFRIAIEYALLLSDLTYDECIGLLEQTQGNLLWDMKEKQGMERKAGRQEETENQRYIG